MSRIVDNRPKRFLAPVALVRAWASVEDGHSLLAELLTVASLARSNSDDVGAAVLSHPRLAEAFEKHPHLASAVEGQLPALHDLLDAFEIYEASSSGQTH